MNEAREFFLSQLIKGKLAEPGKTGDFKITSFGELLIKPSQLTIVEDDIIIIGRNSGDRKYFNQPYVTNVAVGPLEKTGKFAMSKAHLVLRLERPYPNSTDRQIRVINVGDWPIVIAQSTWDVENTEKISTLPDKVERAILENGEIRILKDIRNLTIALPYKNGLGFKLQTTGEQRMGNRSSAEIRLGVSLDRAAGKYYQMVSGQVIK